MIDIIVVNWNAGHQIKSCVDSLGNGIDRHIIIVDNASIDGSIQSIAEVPGVTLIRSTENLGFGKACNSGAQIGSGEYLLFLNPDAVVFPGALERVLAFMEHPANAQVGICGVQLVDVCGHVVRCCSRFPTPVGFVAHAIGLDRLFPRLGHFMVEWAHDNNRTVDHVIGAFYFVRRKVFQALDGFDERFFVYLEDLDFSLRAKQAGWRCVYLADVQSFHAGGGTSNQVKARRLFYSLRSRLLYSFKNFTTGEASMILLATLLLEPISRSALAVARLSWSAIKETWGGYWMLWCWLPQWMLKGITR